jgi:hypothetical protein
VRNEALIPENENDFRAEKNDSFEKNIDHLANNQMSQIIEQFLLNNVTAILALRRSNRVRNKTESRDSIKSFFSIHVLIDEYDQLNKVLNCLFVDDDIDDDLKSVNETRKMSDCAEFQKTMQIEYNSLMKKQDMKND